MTSDELWISVYEYVRRQCPDLPDAQFDKVCAAVRKAMRFLVDDGVKRNTRYHQAKKPQRHT
jgi:hypothetical protein